VIRRDLAHAARDEHDLVIVGGGIYGACLALEAARRGLRPLLLEKGDFGEATSWSSLRILHGGLRYLQRLDLQRFRESVTERRWFCQTFPSLVRPQECLMPLYGDGLKRPLTFGAALLVNDLLSCDRNRGIESARRIGSGRILSAEATVSRFPLVDRRGLRGSGLWYDAVMLNSQRVLIEIVRWACSLGATALNYTKAVRLVTRGDGICGMQACDAVDGRMYTFASRAVCNCAGPWSADVAGSFDCPSPQLFRPSLAFNVLLDRDPPSTSALGVAPRRDGHIGPVYFVYPAFGRLFAGTVHLPYAGPTDQPKPNDEQLQQFLDDLNASIPGLDVRREHVLRVFAGLLPAAEGGSAKLAVRPTICDHRRDGGPDGLVSVSGVKFTTARLVAERTLATFANRLGRLQVRTDVAGPQLGYGLDFDRPPAGVFDAHTVRALRRIVEEEAVLTIDDLLFRRTNWAIVARDLDTVRLRVAKALGWKHARTPEQPKSDGRELAHPGEDARA
jgi:glycerol-3-phosphate dehydrogenase